MGKCIYIYDINIRCIHILNSLVVGTFTLHLVHTVYCDISLFSMVFFLYLYTVGHHGRTRLNMLGVRVQPLIFWNFFFLFFCGILFVRGSPWLGVWNQSSTLKGTTSDRWSRVCSLWAFLFLLEIWVDVSV